LHRRKPAFRAPATHKAMTHQQIARARKLRKQGWALQDIAENFGVQIGRVSDAVNSKHAGK
jgi:transcriptional regulator